MRCLLFVGFAAFAFAQSTVTLLPSEAELTTPESRQQLIVEAASAEGNQDWTRQTTFTSSNPAVAKVDASGVVSPVGDGEATITSKTSSGQTATARIRVKGSGQPFVWSFRNHVTPVLTKMGCNQQNPRAHGLIHAMPRPPAQHVHNGTATMGHQYHSVIKNCLI